MTAGLVQLCLTRADYREAFGKPHTGALSEIHLGGDRGTRQHPEPFPQPRTSGKNAISLSPPTAQEFGVFADEVLTRRRVENDSAVERMALERLSICRACPDESLKMDSDLGGPHCLQFCVGCAGNWHILLVKRISGELKTPGACRHWPGAGDRGLGDGG
jgi:hypothetical protein